MHEHEEHQTMITTKHTSCSLQNTEFLIFIFAINASSTPPITTPTFTDEEVKVEND